MRAVILGGLFGGLILFLWSALSWMVLPLHAQTLHSFKNETLVESALMASLDNDQGGVYMLPNPHGKKNGPFALVIVNPKGWGEMGVHMLIGFLTQVLGAMLVTGLLLKTGGMKYWGRVWFVVMFALTAGVIGHLPQWNWWGYSSGFILAEFVDLFAGWFLAGLVIAKVTK